jgi:PAS domain S-box-containing protein
MLRLPLVLVSLLVSASVAAIPAKPNITTSLSVLTTAREIRALSQSQASQGYPVRLRGIVTYYGGPGWELFVQDKTDGIYVETGDQDLKLHAGQLVEIRGLTAPGLVPMIVNPRIQVLGTVRLPPAPKVSFSSLQAGNEDSRWVETEGIVRSVEEQDKQLSMELASGPLLVSVRLPRFVSSAANLVDSTVIIRGAAGGAYNAKRQFAGACMYVPGLSEIRVEKPAPMHPFDLPVQLIASLSTFSLRHESAGHRVRVMGAVEYQKAGKLLAIRDKTGSIFARSLVKTPVRPGDIVDVVGFIALTRYAPEMVGAAFQRTGGHAPIAPLRASASQALSGAFDSELVQVRGHLLNVWRRQGELELALESGHTIFPAFLDEAQETRRTSLPQIGSLLQLTGVCEIEADASGTPQSFRILLRFPSDITVLASPPWLDQRRLLWLAGGLAFLLGMAGVWVTVMGRKVAAQTALVREWARREAFRREQYEELFENANDIVFTLDMNGRLTSLNRMGERVFGYSRDEALGATLEKMVPPEYQQTALQMLQSKVQGGPPTTYELEIAAKDRHRVPIELSTRLTWQDGKPTGVQGIARDVTERKRAEGAILWERHLLRTLADLSSAQIYFKDAESRFTLISKAQATGFGLSDPAQAVGKSDFDFFPEQHARQAREDELEIMRTGRPVLNKEERLTWPDGRITWVSASKAPLPDRNGRTVGTFGISQDITELKLA